MVELLSADFSSSSHPHWWQGYITGGDLPLVALWRFWLVPCGLGLRDDAVQYSFPFWSTETGMSYAD